jgi:hypothetical protein
MLIVAVLKRCTFSITARENGVLLGLSVAFVGTLLYQGLTGSFEDARHLWILIGLIGAIARMPATEGEDEAQPSA